MNPEYNAREAVWCQSEDCNLSQACLDCLQSQLKRSPEGLLLQEKVGARFSTWAFEDRDKWIALMGQDMDPVGHGYYQALHVALPFIEHENAFGQPFTAAEAQLLLLSNVLHDAHEGIWGDIPKPQKTQQNDLQELELNLQIVSGLLSEDIEGRFMADYRGVVGDLEGWSRPGRAFSAIEYCGYFLSGVNAWSLRHNQQLDSVEQEQCTDMGRTVLQADAPVLESLSSQFSYCQYLLDKYRHLIEESRL